jgi:hypothetical protein
MWSALKRDICRLAPSQDAIDKRCPRSQRTSDRRRNLAGSGKRISTAHRYSADPRRSLGIPGRYVCRCYSDSPRPPPSPFDAACSHLRSPDVSSGSAETVMRMRLDATTGRGEVVSRSTTTCNWETARQAVGEGEPTRRRRTSDARPVWDLDASASPRGVLLLATAEASRVSNGTARQAAHLGAEAGSAGGAGGAGRAEEWWSAMSH